MLLRRPDPVVVVGSGATATYNQQTTQCSCLDRRNPAAIALAIRVCFGGAHRRRGHAPAGGGARGSPPVSPQQPPLLTVGWFTSPHAGCQCQRAPRNTGTDAAARLCRGGAPRSRLPAAQPRRHSRCRGRSAVFSCLCCLLSPVDLSARQYFLLPPSPILPGQLWQHAIHAVSGGARGRLPRRCNAPHCRRFAPAQPLSLLLSPPTLPFHRS